MYGSQRLYGDLRDLGYEVEAIAAQDGTPFAAMRGYAVLCGRFVGRVIDLAVQATADYPRTVASAIHVRADPQLYTCGDSVPNVRNITQSVLGPEWAYWSHNFGWQGERSARRLMSQINGILLNAS